MDLCFMYFVISIFEQIKIWNLDTLLKMCTQSRYDTPLWVVDVTLA